MKRRMIVVALAVMALGSVAAGCNNTTKPQTPEEAAKTTQKQIQDIQNDPNLPPAAKENIIRSMGQQQAVAEARGKGSGEAQAKAAPPGPK